MEKPMGGPAEAPYAPPRVDPGALPFVPMFSESTMLGEQTAPAGSTREWHATTDPRNLTVQMSHAAQDPPATTTAHAVYAEEEIQSQTMQERTMGSADGHGRGHPGGNLWVKDPNTGIWTAGGASCKWLEAQSAEGQQQTSVRRSGVQRSGVIDRSPVLHVYASVAEIELFFYKVQNSTV